MSWPFQFTPQASEDLDTIWWFITKDNQEAADRVEAEIIAICHQLAKYPMMGTMRRDITSLPVRFWTVTKFPNYIIVYRPDTVPLQIIAVLHGRRDLKAVLGKRPF
jgi:plasmid stabilization system protein ParE